VLLLVQRALLDELPEPLPAALQAVLLLVQPTQVDELVDAPGPLAPRLGVRVGGQGAVARDAVAVLRADLRCEGGPILPANRRREVGPFPLRRSPFRGGGVSGLGVLLTRGGKVGGQVVVMLGHGTPRLYSGQW